MAVGVPTRNNIRRSMNYDKVGSRVRMLVEKDESLV